MNNRITINAGANGRSLEIAIPNSAQAITTTNNRAQYFASQAQKYRDEAKNLYDLTKYYAEQNSDVTVEYVTNIKRALELEIAKKQNAGNYLLTKDLPTKVSGFENDANYVNQSEMAEAVNILPEKTGNSGMFLKTDGTNLSWAKTYHPPLLSYFWSEHKLNDIALLLANTFSWQSSEAYSNAYNKLVEEYDNESSTTETSGTITYKLTPNGFKIADATQEQAILDLYNSTGSAKIYILDKENTRFKLPRWKHINNVETDDMYLYFYVGEYTQSAIEQTAGLNAELLNAKADLTTPAIQAPYLKTSYINGTSGYNIWSNGYCEQWGYMAVSQSSSGVYTIAYLKTFADTNYSISTANNSTGANNYSPNIRSYTTTNMVVYNSVSYAGFWWKVSGYLASDEY